eukprot:1703962-Amphidinium_carterae.1
MAEARQHSAAACLGGMVYIAGGWNGREAIWQEILGPQRLDFANFPRPKTCTTSDTSEQQHRTKLSNMETRHISCELKYQAISSLSWNGEGWTAIGYEVWACHTLVCNEAMNSVERFNPDVGRWTQLESMPERREGSPTKYPSLRLLGK